MSIFHSFTISNDPTDLWSLSYKETQSQQNLLQEHLKLKPSDPVTPEVKLTSLKFIQKDRDRTPIKKNHEKNSDINTID